NNKISKVYLLSRDHEEIEVNLLDFDDFTYNRNKEDDRNYYSIIIGNNGTGKSRILSGIANYFIGRKPRNYRIEIEPRFSPDKVIAMTSSISDKFPIDDSMRNIGINSSVEFRNELYTYLGNRNKTFGFSSRALINRALDIIFQTYDSIKNNRRTFAHIFKYLDYEPILRVHSRIRHDKLKRFVESKQGSFFNENLFIEYINDQSLKTDFNKKYFNDLIESYQGNSTDIVSFLNDLLISNRRGISIDLSFSNDELSFYEDQSSLFEDSRIKTYKLLSILQRIGLVGSYDIRLISKKGFEFKFDEASSGEANILSSMLALAALAQDNSIILIDEPEISLHPHWQYKYMDLVRETLKHVRRCHIIVATHSHFILSDVPEEDSTVVALQKNKDHKVTSKIIKKETYNQSADFILLNIFGIPTTRNWYLRRIIS
ncbi:MAG: ATP-binding protein, partial [Romboutsia sp.]|nr:ATP-binding protein [Romboutsia sp.]